MAFTTIAKSRTLITMLFCAALAGCAGENSTGGPGTDGGTNDGGAQDGAVVMPDAATPGESEVLLPTGELLEIPEVPDRNASYDCGEEPIRCVPDEYPNIQAAADVVVAGDTVVVSAGNYEAFTLSTTGTKDAPIRFVGRTGVIIDSFTNTDHGITLRSDFDNDYYVDYAQIVGFRIESPPRRCIYMTKAIASRPSVGHLIAQNICLDAGQEGFVLSQMSLSVVEDNIILNAGNGSDESALDHGIYLGNGGTGNSLIRRNVIMGSSTAGIHHNGDESVDTGGTDGIISGLIVDGNIIIGNGQNGCNMDGVQDSHYINNVFYANDKHAIRSYAIDGAQGPKNIVAINNTMIGNDSAFKMSDSLGGHIVFNNLIVDADEEAIVVPNGELTDSANIISSTIKFVRLPANLEGDLAEISNFDFRAVKADRGSLVNMGSASIGGISAPSHDRGGVLRDGAPDVGAVEY